MKGHLASFFIWFWIGLCFIAATGLSFSIWDLPSSWRPVYPAMALCPASVKAPFDADIKKAELRDLISAVVARWKGEAAPPSKPPWLEKIIKLETMDLRAAFLSEEIRREGEDQMRSGRCFDALKRYCEALSFNQNNSKVWKSLGQWYVLAGDLLMAELSYNVALKLGALDGDLLNDLGVLFYQEGRTEEAMEMWSIARGLPRWLGVTDFNEGLVWLEQGEWAEALYRITRYTEHAPRDVEALRVQAYLLKEMGQPMDALRILQKALTENPSNPALYGDVAAAAALSWLPDVALEHLEKLEELSSPELVLAVLQEPAFSEFRKTRMGKSMESILLVQTRGAMPSTQMVEDRLALCLNLRFSCATSTNTVGNPIVANAW